MDRHDGETGDLNIVKTDQTVFGDNEDAVQKPLALNILMVDDDPVDAIFIERICQKISRYAITFQAVTSSREALDIIRTQTFDAFFMDFWLGMETAIPLIDQLRANTACPIIVMTSLKSADVQKLALRAGAIGYLSKADISVRALESMLTTVLHQKQVEVTLTASLRDMGVENTSQQERMLTYLQNILQHANEVHAMSSLLSLGSEPDTGLDQSEELRRMASKVALLRESLFDTVIAFRAAEIPHTALFKRFDMVELINEVMQTMKYDMDLHDHTVSFIKPQIAVLVEGDRLSLFQVFMHVFCGVLGELRHGAYLEIAITIEDGKLYVAFESKTLKASWQERADILHEALEQRAASPSSRKAQSIATIRDLLAQHHGKAHFFPKGLEGTIVLLEIPLRQEDIPAVTLA